MKSSESVRSFFRYFGVDIRREEVICSLLPFGLFIYQPLINFMSDPQVINTGNMITIVVSFFTLIILAKKSGPGKRESKNGDAVKLWNLSKERKIPFPTNPFHVVDKKKFLALTTNDKRIFLGKEYLNLLKSDDEIAFVLGHESYHYHSKETLFDMGIIFLILGTEFGVEVFTHNFLFPLVCMCPLLFLFSQIRRSRESMADIHGLGFSNENAAKNALEIRYDMEKSTMFDFHPRLKIRIRNIKNQISKY